MRISLFGMAFSNTISLTQIQDRFECEEIWRGKWVSGGHLTRDLHDHGLARWDP
jgi:hypothetical protein